MVDIVFEGVRYVPLPKPIVRVGGEIYMPAGAVQEEPVPSEPELGRWEAALRALEPDYPTGAWGMSDATAEAQVRMSGGRDASRRMVEINITRAVPEGYWERIRTAAAEFGLPIAVVCAIFCRESHHGFHLNEKGEGDGGNAFGVGQVDYRSHAVRGQPDPYSLDHMRQCCEILVDNLEQVEKKHPTWPDKYVLKGGVNAYNFGVSNVKTIERMDQGSTGDDYGADTCARAQLYRMFLRAG